MPTLHTVIRRPVITEKGLGVKEAENTLVFEVAPNATKTEVKRLRQRARCHGGGRPVARLGRRRPWPSADGKHGLR